MSDEARQTRIEEIAIRAGDCEEEARNCAQGTFFALKEEFGLAGGDELLNAAMFMPGVGSRKETCGALLGGLMALGLRYGRCRLIGSSATTPEDEEEMLRIRREKILRYCEAFKAEFGSTACGVIRPLIMGRDYDSLDPEDRKVFKANDGYKKCRRPAETAARIAAEILLED